MKEVKDEEGLVSYIWKNNLMESQQFWRGWFQGLSSDFLSSKFCKLLLLASNDRMDKELTIAHMQGRFKLVCFVGDIGHCMMEDDPF